MRVTDLSNLGNVSQFDGTGETLVTSRIVVLQGDLQLHGLQKLPTRIEIFLFRISILVISPIPVNLSNLEISILIIYSYRGPHIVSYFSYFLGYNTVKLTSVLLWSHPECW